MPKKKHKLPAVVEINFNTGEKRVLEYVELDNKEYEKQVLQPLAKILYDQMKRDIESGKFNPDEIPEQR